MNISKIKVGSTTYNIKDPDAISLSSVSSWAQAGNSDTIPSSKLPSYVDDVLEYASMSLFPEIGETGKIYVAIDTNKTYRWGGSSYVVISETIAIGTTQGTAYDGAAGAALKSKLDGIENGAQAHKAPTSTEVKSALGTGSGTSKYLREDGTWLIPTESIVASDNIRKASQIGLIPNDSTKGSANGAIIASLITEGKSLFMDKDEVYYINGSSWEIGYEFSISGKATIVCNGYMFKPVAGGSIIFDGITFKGTDGLPEDALIVNMASIDYQINTISITNCVFDGVDRIALLTGADQDYATTQYGIKDFRFEGCRVVNIHYKEISMSDLVISNSCIIKNNYVEEMKSIFIDMGTTNTNTYKNDEYNCDIVIDGNVVTGCVYNVSTYSYYTFALIEASRIIYTNNTVSNLIGLYGPTYDAYLSCSDVVYEGNKIKNVCNLPQTTDNPVYTEIFKSKSVGRKHVCNNFWSYDFDECRSLVADAGVTYTDERWGEINKVDMFRFQYTVDLTFCNNHLFIKGGDISSITSSYPIRTALVDSNVIDVDGFISGYVLAIWNEVTEEFVVTNNIFRSKDTWTIPLFGESVRIHDFTANNMTLLCANNYSTVPIRNIGSKGTGKFTFKDNTYKNYPEDKLRTWYYLEGTNGTRSEVYGSSSKIINFNSFTNGAIVTLHSDIESQGSYMELYIENNPEFDFCIPGINRAYKIRNDNGTINLYDKYDNMVTTITSAFATVIQSGDVRVDIRKYGEVPGLIFNYYDSVGHHDIEFADKELGLYDVNDNYEKPISVVSAADTTLTAKVGKYYRYDSSVTSLAVTLPAMSDTSRIQSIILSLTTGSSASVTFASADSKAITYSSGYNIETGKSYEINCLFNGMKWVIASMEVL